MGQHRVNPFNRLGKDLGCVLPPHSRQNDVITALKRNMEMRHEIGKSCHEIQQTFIHLGRLHRTEANPQCRKTTAQGLQQRVDILTLGQIQTVFARIDTGDHQLLILFLSKNCNLGKDIRQRQAPASPSGVRDYAVGTEIITTVLNTKIGPGSAAESPYRQGTDFPSFSRIFDRRDRAAFFQGRADQEVLISITDNNQRAVRDKLGQLIRGKLGIAAGNQQTGIRIIPPEPADQLP